MLQDTIASIMESLKASGMKVDGITAYPSIEGCPSCTLHITQWQGRVVFKLYAEKDPCLSQIPENVLPSLIEVYSFIACGDCKKQENPEKCRFSARNLVRHEHDPHPERISFRHTTSTDMVPHILMELCEYLDRCADHIHGLKMEAGKILSEQVRRLGNQTDHRYIAGIQPSQQLSAVRNHARRMIDLGNY